MFKSISNIFMLEHLSHEDLCSLYLKKSKALNRLLNLTALSTICEIMKIRKSENRTIKR